MSINITYTASSGNVYDLMADKAIRTKTANYHKWSWGVVKTSQQFGDNVTGFTRAGSVYTTKLMFRGTYAANKTQIENLHEDFELDIYNRTPGTIQWGDYYVRCFITASSTYPDDNNRTVNDIEIYCPYPFWQKDVSRSFQIGSGGGGTGLDYPFDYDYDYAQDASGDEVWAPGTNLPSEYTMIIYGAATDPVVTINGSQFGAYATLLAGDYLTIDSRNHTVTKTANDGTVTNLFDYRLKNESIFSRIPGGSLAITWSGLFAFDLILHTERSEPR